MLTRSKITEMQQKKLYINNNEEKMDDVINKYIVIDFEEVLELCQKYITRIATKAFRFENDPQKKREMTIIYINDFVNSKKPIVKNYSNVNDLKQALIDEITHYGPITKAMEDPSIDEIRVNGPDQIFVESGGKTLAWEHSFTDREHMERIIAKLIGISKVRLTPKIPMVNARSIEGYRVNATHASISPYNTPALVIRKFNKKNISPETMMKSKSFSVNMFKLLSLIPKSDLSWITVGSTGSGKTTFNEILVKEKNPLIRI